jgi:DNA modification methylase
VSVEILHGDCREVLATLPEQSVQTCVTSPPYWGLRDYGTARWEGGREDCGHIKPKGTILGKKSATFHGSNTQAAHQIQYAGECRDCGATRVDAQLGLERTPDEYVAKMVEVFRAVRRVLRDDGTLWLNLGDSYAGGNTTGTFRAGSGRADGIVDAERRQRNRNGIATHEGLKPKDLVGIPWSVAKALQAPYYTGRIRDERDRIWLAAMLDAEGCMFIHKRKAGQHNGQGYYRQNANYGPGVEISNTSLAVVERIAALVGKGSICSQGPEENARRKQTIYRWNLRTTECRDFVRELYPYLIAKQQQARILYGCPSSGERAEAAHEGLMALHRTGTSPVDFPAPPTMYEPGYYLRSDIIWSKCNPMPESVTDRPTKAHEYLFLLTKSERYYYDADAIREPFTDERMGNPGAPSPKALVIPGQSPHTFGRKVWDKVPENGGRNRRSVWTVATRPYKGAHFATFPPKLIEPCILAGSASKACEHCGAAWVRITEVIGEKQRRWSGNDTPTREDNWRQDNGRDTQAIRATTGWEPSCDCDDNTGTARSVVLDPFGGSGTTGAVAEQHGRNAILIELNAAYLPLQHERLAKVQPVLGVA